MDLMITNINAKGQVVIPANLRKSFGITPEVPLQFIAAGRGIMLYPVDAVIRKGDLGGDYLLKMVRETRGAWGKETRADKKREEKIREAEHKAAEQLKKAW